MYVAINLLPIKYILKFSKLNKTEKTPYDLRHCPIDGRQHGGHVWHVDESVVLAPEAVLVEHIRGQLQARAVHWDGVDCYYKSYFTWPLGSLPPFAGHALCWALA